MVNTTKILNDFLIENGVVSFDTIFNDVFPEDQGECLISRYDPSRANETEFIDGSAIGYVALSYYCRSNDAEKCRKELNAICGMVDNLRLFDTTDGTEYRFKAVSLPSFVSVDDKEQTIYVCDIAADFDRKGE